MADKVHICVVYFKWSFVFTGTMCLISAYTTNYWQQNTRTRIGLWKICEGGINCSSIKFEENAGMLSHYQQHFFFLGYIDYFKYSIEKQIVDFTVGQIYMHCLFQQPIRTNIKIDWVTAKKPIQQSPPLGILQISQKNTCVGPSF